MARKTGSTRHRRVASRPAHMVKMTWLMPRMAKAVPYLGYILLTATEPV